ncbi:Guanyl-specific ribonuclease Sa [Amycolatopsis marina]|uniref:Guanyl-specific ribonuclease Sa n=1 Tax=Amycolatopsis marina TaxID=490629 RepID=A0A1I0YEL1_9PSEU|nr:ribonuclease domain-containing protein [Amycolatopsis marina]SFB11805.1 Guanyl-specific ribonuclease Sa [Amycolatopsis marina]
MTNIRMRSATTLFVLLFALLGGLGFGAAQALPAAQQAQVAQAAQAACGDTSGFEKTPLSALPAEASETYDLIQSDGPFPYPDKDGTVFQNREGLLPDCSSGYYHEYTVPTPGSPDRGARRIVTGEGGEYFYTADHYASFVLIDVDGEQGTACGDLSELDTVAYSALSSAARAVVDDARDGATGITYENREGVLPACESGYYQLHQVGEQDRVIAGDGGEIAYTPDHYRTFLAVDLAA